MDFNAISQTINFPVGSTHYDEICIDITGITDDSVLERDKTFILSMTVVAGNPTIRNTVTTITIIDDDG